MTAREEDDESTVASIIPCQQRRKCVLGGTHLRLAQAPLPFSLVSARVVS